MNAVRRVVSRSCMVRLWPWYANAHNHLLLTLHSVYSVQQPFCIWIHLFFPNSIEKFHPLNLILIEMTVSIYLSLFFFFKLLFFSSLFFSFYYNYIVYYCFSHCKWQVSWRFFLSSVIRTQVFCRERRRCWNQYMPTQLLLSSTSS